LPRRQGSFETCEKRKKKKRDMLYSEPREGLKNALRTNVFPLTRIKSGHKARGGEKGGDSSSLGGLGCVVQTIASQILYAGKKPPQSKPPG